VAELPRETTDIIDVIAKPGGSEGAPHINVRGNTHAERVQEALGNMYMDQPCSNCGSSKVIRAGACGCCTDCGTSQGCS
jgi:ribonucleoside-diphosphate reductase alpha chain